MAIRQLGYKLLRDLSGGSEKSGQVPANRAWTILWGHVKYTASAAPGQRFICMRARLPGDPSPLARTWSGEPQEPNSVRRYQFFPGWVQAGANSGEVTFVALPPKPTMLAGWEFSLYDSAGIDPNDHLELRALVILEERI